MGIEGNPRSLFIKFEQGLKFLARSKPVQTGVALAILWGTGAPACTPKEASPTSTPEPHPTPISVGVSFDACDSKTQRIFNEIVNKPLEEIAIEDILEFNKCAKEKLAQADATMTAEALKPTATSSPTETTTVTATSTPTEITEIAPNPVLEELPEAPEKILQKMKEDLKISVEKSLSSLPISRELATLFYESFSFLKGKELPDWFSGNLILRPYGISGPPGQIVVHFNLKTITLDSAPQLFSPDFNLSAPWRYAESLPEPYKTYEEKIRVGLFFAFLEGAMLERFGDAPQGNPILERGKEVFFKNGFPAIENGRPSLFESRHASTGVGDQFTDREPNLLQAVAASSAIVLVLGERVNPTQEQKEFAERFLKLIFDPRYFPMDRQNQMTLEEIRESLRP